jgi:molybdopterin converting factor subunit 1
MKIKVLFFAQLREALGEQERIVEVQEEITARKLACQLLEQAGLQSLKSLPLLYAVNEHLVRGEEKLSDENVLALMPPVAGG